MYDLALDAFRDADGDLVCLPQNVSSLVVYYNRDLFEAAGVPLPRGGLDVGRHDRRGGGAARRRAVRPRRRGVDHPPGAVRVVERRRHRRRPDTTDAPHAGHPGVARRARALPRARHRRPHPDRGGVGGRGRRGTVRQRTSGDVPQLAAGDAAVPAHRRLRVGRRPPARARRARRRAALRRLLPDRRLRAPRRRLLVPRVRPRPGGRAGDRPHRPDRAVAAIGRRVGRLPRPVAAPGVVGGVPRHDPGDPRAADDLHVAGDRERRQRDPRGGAGPTARPPRRSPGASTRRPATCSRGRSDGQADVRRRRQALRRRHRARRARSRRRRRRGRVRARTVGCGQVDGVAARRRARAPSAVDGC